MIRTTLLAASAALALVSSPALADDAQDVTAVQYRTAVVDGTYTFYREAGASTAPTILLLHGFPTSSQMFRNLIPRLADKYHVVAPDYPGFGQSASPDRAKFAYTFDHYAELVGKLTEQIGVSRYAL